MQCIDLKIMSRVVQKCVFWVSDTNKTVFSRSIELDLPYMCMGYHMVYWAFVGNFKNVSVFGFVEAVNDLVHDE